MTKKERIFKALWHVNAEVVLDCIYRKKRISFKELSAEFPRICRSSLRLITNRLVRAKLIRSVKNVQSCDKRKRVYVIKDLASVETILNLKFD